MKKFKENIWFYLLITLFIIIIVGLASVEIFCWITYGKKPITEIPSWALWFMIGKR